MEVAAGRADWPGWARRRCSRMRSRLRCAAGSATGTAESSASVYGCCGAAKSASVVAELHDLAEIHHRHPVADMLDDAQIVRDEEVGQAELAPADRPAGSAPAPAPRHRARRPARRRRSDPGCSASARAMPMRWRWPPLKACGIARACTRAAARPLAAARRPGPSAPAAADSVDHAAARRRCRRTVMRGLSERERVLEDHLHPRPQRAAARGVQAERDRRLCRRASKQDLRRRSARSGAAGSGRRWSCRSRSRPPAPASRPRRRSKLTPSTACTCPTVASQQAPADRESTSAGPRPRAARSRGCASPSAVSGRRRLRAESAGRRSSAQLRSAGASSAPDGPAPSAISSGGSTQRDSRSGQRGWNGQPRGTASGWERCRGIELEPLLRGAAEDRDRAQQAARVRVLRVVEDGVDRRPARPPGRRTSRPPRRPARR